MRKVIEFVTTGTATLAVYAVLTAIAVAIRGHPALLISGLLMLFLAGIVLFEMVTRE